MREIEEFGIMEQLDADIERVMEYIRNEAHIGMESCCGGSYYEEPPCEKLSGEWYIRIEDYIRAVFEGTYMYVDYLKEKYEGKEACDDVDYPDEFEF